MVKYLRGLGARLPYPLFTPPRLRLCNQRYMDAMWGKKHSVSDVLLEAFDSHVAHLLLELHPLSRTFLRSPDVVDVVHVSPIRGLNLEAVHLHSRGMSVEIHLEKQPQSTQQGSSPNAPVIGSLVYCESMALDHALTNIALLTYAEVDDIKSTHIDKRK
ncbi:unnamed protein product [Timema podura]|uniref:Uncharacterized protein n=1 Tax=Timema podura TaxID=61482 RepID=A0ABN7NRG3_TIMPD|nr:unnamed protein product [Timema podura]